MRIDPGSEFARAVDERLGTLIHAAPVGEILGAAARHLCMAAGARRLRPRLVQGVGELLSVPARRLVDFAAAVEAIHGASLLHDDVVDEGTLRRGIPTANARFGNDVAVLAGDFTLVRAFGALRSYSGVLTDHAIELVEEMTRAAILEIERRGRPDLTVGEWRAVAEGKCGSLFGYCCAGAAIIAGRPELSLALDAFGRRMGSAFQMADDLRDLVAASLGKDRYADLKNKNPSFVLSALPPALETELRTLWASRVVTPREASAFAGKLSQHGIVERALAALDDELLAAVALWTSASLPAHVAKEICGAIRAQLECRENA